MNATETGLMTYAVRATGIDKPGLLQHLASVAKTLQIKMLAGVAHTFGNQAIIFFEIACEPEQLVQYEEQLKRTKPVHQLDISTVSVEPNDQALEAALPWQIQVTTVNAAGVLEYLSEFIANKGITIISWHGEPYTPPRAVDTDACIQTFTVLLPRNTKHMDLLDELEDLRRMNQAVLSTTMIPL